MKHIQINSLSDQHIHFHTVIQIVWISYPDADCRYSMHARQFLALCEILEIYDIYTEFVGQSPLNPFRNLNENGMNKVLEYISDLESTGNYKPAEIIPIHVIREKKYFTIPFPLVPALFLIVTNMRYSPLLTFRRLPHLAYM